MPISSGYTDLAQNERSPGKKSYGRRFGHYRRAAGCFGAAVRIERPSQPQDGISLCLSTQEIHQKPQAPKRAWTYIQQIKAQVITVLHSDVSNHPSGITDLLRALATEKLFPGALMLVEVRFTLGRIAIYPCLDALSMHIVQSIPGYRMQQEAGTWSIPDSLEAIGIFLFVAYRLQELEQHAFPLEETPDNSVSARYLKRYREALKTRHYSSRTIGSYLNWLERFLSQYEYRDPMTLTQYEANSFLTNLAITEKVSSSTQNQALSAILFFFRYILGNDKTDLSEIVRAKQTLRLPVVLSLQEVRSILSYMQGDTGLAAALLYGTGMRISECLSLRVQDIDFGRNEILIRNGKGAKDRHTMLPSSLKDALFEHLKRIKAIHEDRKSVV